MHPEDRVHRDEDTSTGLAALDLATLRTMLDASVDSILVIDEHGTIMACNRAVPQNFGYRIDELVGRNVSMLMPRGHRDRHDGYLQNYLDTGERRIIGIGREVNGRRKDGTEFPLHLSVGEFATAEGRFFFGICHDITERRELNDRIVRMATRDSLTGCLNRHHLVERIDRISEDRQRFCVLFIDLDGFKAVNDNHGHRLGDRVLTTVAERMRATLGDADLLGRVGGDEFVAVLADVDDACAGQRHARRLLDAMGQTLRIGEVTIGMSASIGVSLFPDHGESADELINHADVAMYHAKLSARGDRQGPSGADDRSGATGDQAYVFDSKLRDRTLKHYSTLNRLRQAIEAGRLEVHYQPQFDIATLEPCGLEALVRWREDDGTLVMPGEFIPIARRHGLKPALTRLVLERACRDNVALIRAGFPALPVAVNVSANTVNDPAFLPLVQATLAATGLPPRLLEIEITEDISLGASPQTLRNALDLIGSGVQLVMDDYGAGFSSLKHLKQLRFGKIKLDRGFISALPQSVEDQSIVRATLMMTREMRIPLLAEGVESEEQLDYLRAHGCEMGQGYWYARPMPFEQLVAFLRRRREAACVD